MLFLLEPSEEQHGTATSYCQTRISRIMIKHLGVKLGA